MNQLANDRDRVKGAAQPSTGAERLQRLFSFRVFYGVLVCLMALGAVFVLIQTIRLLPAIDDNMYPEASNIVVAERWVMGSPLYADFRQPPYLITGFPPMWFGGLALAAKAGLSGVDSLTLFGRIVSVIFLCATAWLGYVWARREGFEARFAVLPPVFFLAFPALVPWAATARPDFPTLFFSLLAALLAARGPSALNVGLASLSAAAAFLIKHSSVAAPIAIVLWLVSLRRWRHAALFCLVWFLVVGTTLAGFEISSGGLMSLNLLGHHFGARSLSHVHDTFVRLWKPAGSGFSLVLLAFGLLGSFYSWDSNRSRLLAVYLVTSLVIAAGGSGGAGGNVNYYFEPAAVLAFLVPLGLERLRRDWTPRSATATFMGLVVVVVLLPSLDVQRWKAFGAGPSGLQGAVAVVANKRILTDVPYLGARSVRPELLDPVSHVNLEESDSWQSDGLVKAVLAGDYDLVILHLSLDDLRWKSGRYITFSDSIRSAIARRYRFCFELDSLYVYGRAMDEETNGPSVECPAAPARAADPAAASDARPSPALSAAR